MLKKNETIDYEQHYVVYNSKPVRKYFEPRNGWSHFWAPTLNQLARIEALYYKLWLRAQQYYAKKEALLKQIKEVAPKFKDVCDVASANDYRANCWVFHAKVNHGTSVGKNDWWRYRIYTDEESSFDPESGTTFSFDWVNEPETKYCLDLGQQFYQLDQISIPIWSMLLTNLLEDAIINYAEKYFSRPPAGMSRNYKLDINDRSYWIVGFRKNKTFVEYKIIHWPTGKTEEHSVKGYLE